MTPELPAVSERSVQRSIVRFLEQMDFWVYNLSQSRRTRQSQGFPDLYAMNEARGLALWVEVKKPGGRQSPDQLLFQQRCDATTVPYVLAYSADDVARFLASHVRAA